MTDKDKIIVEKMEKHGNKFVRALANCLKEADKTNFERLKYVFIDYFIYYDKLVEKEEPKENKEVEVSK